MTTWSVAPAVQTRAKVQVFRNTVGRSVWNGRAFGPDHKSARCLHNHLKRSVAYQCGERLTRKLNETGETPPWARGGAA